MNINIQVSNSEFAMIEKCTWLIVTDHDGANFLCYTTFE